jgi:oligoendopeptidase F
MRTQDHSQVGTTTVEASTLEVGVAERSVQRKVSPSIQATTEPQDFEKYEAGRWDLSELLPEPDEEAIAREISLLEAAVEHFEKHRDTLDVGMGPEAILVIMQEYESIIGMIDVLGGYASLWFASDTQSAPAVGFRNRMWQLIAGLQNRFLFFELWWQGLTEEEATPLLPKVDEEPDFHHYLYELRLFSPYALDERSEQLINTKNTNGVQAVLTLYSMLTNRLEFHPVIGGERKTLTDGEMRSLFYHPDPDVRKEIHRELFHVYGKEAPILAQIYANRVRDWATDNVELRGFSSPIAVRNLRNDMPDAAVATLLDVVHQNVSVFQDYFRLKGTWLGITPLRRYDLYASLATSSQSIDFSTAANEVLETFRGFDERFASLAERVFRERHLDSEIRKGKRGGAFCSTVNPRFTPWVMLNYAGRVRDVATLAHELGHAVHSMLAEHHSTLVQHPSLPLAETASVFAEMMMTDRLLAKEKDPIVRREILAAAVDDVYATVMRQTFFVRFEIAAHAAVMANKSAEDLHDLYLQNLKEQFGDSMDITPEFRYEWVSIPHLFSTPFYCYAYSFGQLLVLALYRRYQQEGEAFKPGYFRLLSYGGAARPETILRELDIEITDASFWQGGFDVVRDMIAELRAIEIP